MGSTGSHGRTGEPGDPVSVFNMVSTIAKNWD